LVSILKNIAQSVALGSMSALLVLSLALTLPSPVWADTAADAETHVGAEVLTSQDGWSGNGPSGQVSTSEQIHHETLNQSEEFLLNKTLKLLKANNLSEAVKNLEKLKDAFPDNDDYLLLYRTAVRKKNSSDSDSQKWWAYERSVDRKEKSSEGKPTPASEIASAALSKPGHGRINQLKHANWVILTTGKHKSPNDGRRVQRPVDQDQD